MNPVLLHQYGEDLTPARFPDDRDLLDDVPTGQLSRLIARIRLQVARARVLHDHGARVDVVARIAAMLALVEEAYREETLRLRRELDLPF